MPTPRLLELTGVDLALTPDEAWEVVRHGDLGRSAIARALFTVRTWPSRLAGETVEGPVLKIDELRSSAERPGFQVLLDEPGHEVVVGAIGQVWQLDIPFVHVADAAAFAAFAAPGYVKVAWALRVSPLGERDARVDFEVRVDATDEASWEKFRAYFRLIGPGSHLIRRLLLSGLAREHGTPASVENERPLLGDELLPDAAGQDTQAVTIDATPEAIWPWLLQMGCDRAGFYSVDVLDNRGHRSEDQIIPELTQVRVGDVIPATRGSREGFEVLRLEPGKALVLGGLYDGDAGKQLPFAAARPLTYWHVTWAFVLEPLDERHTRLHVRARAAFSPGGGAHARWMTLVHHFMESAQLRHLRQRVEGRTPRDGIGDVAEGVLGASIMVAAYLTPFARTARSHWGIDEATAARSYPGDGLVRTPRWGWTHGIEIAAPAETVWRWVAQIGADRGGFYSYQWLENVAGCEVRNAEGIHPEWEIRAGGTLSLHPKMPPLAVSEIEPGHHYVAYAGPDAAQRASGPWVETSWLFFVEPLGPARSRFISRYRCDGSNDLATRLAFGAVTIEPIGFAMDRRMLLGVKERAERALAERMHLG